VAILSRPRLSVAVKRSGTHQCSRPNVEHVNDFKRNFDSS
jgi:hypothetical protein